MPFLLTANAVSLDSRCGNQVEIAAAADSAGCSDLGKCQQTSVSAATWRQPGLTW
jgi:hypothetical protein